jgi:glycerol-3-phosphate O-acyltransferase
LRAIRSLQRRYGAVHLRFGAPISLRTYLAEAADEMPEDADDTRSPAIPKLAFELSVRINEVTPITPISLVTLALLSEEDRSLTVDETIDRLRPFLEIVARRDLPMTEKLDATNRVQVEAALDELVLHGVVSRFDGATDVVYRVGPQQHLAAAYYRNTIIHFFVNVAITEVALLAADAREQPYELAPAVVEEALAIRDLLKFEFFFSSREEFEQEIRFELGDHDVDWRDHLAVGEARKVLTGFDPFFSPTVLRPFIEAYRVVADLIEQAAFHSTIDQDQLRKDAMALGKQYLLQGRIRSAESVSNVLFDSAIDLATNRGLFAVGPDMVERRKGFAAEIRRISGHLDSISAIAVGREAGVLE